MRTPNNDPAALTDGMRAGGAKASPERSCILTRETGARGDLVRLALSPDGDVLPDVRARAPGRGAWIGVDLPTLEAAVAKGRLRGALARAFKGAALRVPDDLGRRIADALERHALDRLGLEAKAGHVATGTTAIDKAARAGRLHALYHAADAAGDGAAKLAQAWRVGLGEEGSGRRGVALPVPRTILSLALGRENVVHLGIADARAAARAEQAIGRWLRFIGTGGRHAPCETSSDGASATPDGSTTNARGDAAGTMKQDSE